MEFLPDRFYHVFNQGNNRQKVFENGRNDYHLFLWQARKHILPHVDILAYCLMPNHFHFMIKTDQRCLGMRMAGKWEINEVCFGIKMLLSTYTLITNKVRGRTGSLFRQGTHARCLKHDPYSVNLDKMAKNDLTNVFRYIHENPVEANLVKNPADWPYSSYRDYAGIRNGTLVNKKLALEFGLG
jgi:putative transposase